MLNINIITVGTLKEKYWIDACREYEKRLSAYCKLSVTEIAECRLSDNASEKEVLRALDIEGKRILEKAGKSSKIIAMCIEGKKLSSVKFADMINCYAINGSSSLVFVVGSSCGLSDTIKEAADIKLSLSDMTFPHQLFKVILLEQLYRGFQINNKGKYHK